MEGPQGAPIPYSVGIGVGIGYTLEYMDEGLLSFSRHFLALALEELKALSTTSANADADADFVGYDHRRRHRHCCRRHCRHHCHHHHRCQSHQDMKSIEILKICKTS